MKLTRAARAINMNTKDILKTFKFHGETFEYNGKVYKTNPKLLDPSYIQKSQINTVKKMAPYVSAILPTEKNNYYLYHKIRLKGEAKSKKADEEYNKKLLAEKILNPSSLPTQEDVTSLGQEEIWHTHDDWLYE